MPAFLKKILFVDDDESQRDVMQRILVRLGYDAEFAKNAKEALELLDKKKIPLIITDLKMPGMDGIELCIQIRKVNTESFIYAFSGYLAEFELEKLEEFGFDGHLSKPVELSVLERAIEGAFEKIGQREE